MSYTATPEYTSYLTGQFLAAAESLGGFNDQYDVDPQSGAVTFRMWDGFTSALVDGTTQLTDGIANLSITGTGATAAVTKVAKPHELNSPENTTGLVALVPQAVDTLKRRLQNQIVATLKAASLGKSATLTAGWKDFKAPAAATNPDVANEVFGQMQSLLAYVRSHAQGASNSDLFIWTAPDPFSYLTANRQYWDGLLQREGDIYMWDGVPLTVIAGATSFGGASNESVFAGHKKGFGLKFKEPYVQGGGWVDVPHLGISQWNIMLPYFYATVNTSLLGEIINGAT